MDWHNNQISEKISCEYKTFEKFRSQTLGTSKNASILVVHINIVTLNKNFDSFKLFLNQFPKTVDVICLSETRLTDRNVRFCDIAGYHFFYCNSKTRAGGSAIYVTDNLKCQQLCQIKIKTSGCEDVWVKINHGKNESLVVGSVYRHPHNDNKSFEDAFVNVIKSFKANQNYVVLGDYNINYDKAMLSQATADYINHIASLGCIQLIDKPTRISQTANTEIDHIYVNSSLLNYVLPFIFYEDITDHLPNVWKSGVYQTKQQPDDLILTK